MADACDPERADAPLPAAVRRRGAATFVQRGVGLSISAATLARGGALQAGRPVARAPRPGSLCTAHALATPFAVHTLAALC